MTIEQKAKAYDEALKVIKECNPDENGFITIYPQEIFSELAESEDERIRKWLEETIESMSDNNIIFKDVRRIDVLHWLEKQGEKKEISITIPDNLVGTDMDGGVIGEKGEDGMKPQVDGFDAELNSLLKKYEHLSKKELQEPLEFYLGVVRDDLDIVREEKPKWSEEEIKEAQLDYWRSVGGKEWHGVPVQETIAWLEKQGGQKWSEEDEIGSDATIELLEYFINYAPEFRKPAIRRSIDWIESLKKRMEE